MTAAANSVRYPRRSPGRLPPLGAWILLSVLGAHGVQSAGAGREPEGLHALPEVLGTLSMTAIAATDTLLDVALRHRLGFEAVRRLNPALDVWLPAPGAPVLLPTAMIPPDAPRDGLVINIPEMRLYDFTVGAVPEVFAIAIGDDHAVTPEGDFAIGRKRVNPTWYVPESIRAEDPELPAQVPPGPDNPLGDRWMTIGNSSYGIHGTNVEWSIGRVATHGCIRLYTQDIHRLYDRVPEGTPVHLVYQPVKLGVRGSSVFLEVHPDIYGRGQISSQKVRVELLVRGLLGTLDPATLDHAQIERAMAEARGIPIAIATLASPQAP